MASIDKPGSKYRVRWRASSGRARSRTCPDLRTARRLKRDIERAKAEGRDWRPRDSAGLPTLTEIFRAYLKDCRARGYAQGTLRNRDLSLRTFLRFLEERDGAPLLPALLSRDALVAFMDHCETTSCSRLTASQWMKPVEAAWRWAAEESDEYDDVVPRPKRVRVRHTGPGIRPYAPTWAEMDAGIREGLTRGRPRGWYGKAFIVCRFTGIRINQALRLTWADVDLDAATLTIRPELGKTTAERRGRIVPVSAHLVSELSTWGRRDGWIVPGPANRVLNYGQTLHPLWRAAGVRPEALRQPTHLFRRGFRTGLRSAGVDPDLIDYLLGHKTGSTGGDVYTDLVHLQPQLRAAVATIPPLDLGRVSSLEIARQQRSADG